MCKEFGCQKFTKISLTHCKNANMWIMSKISQNCVDFNHEGGSFFQKYAEILK